MFPCDRNERIVPIKDIRNGFLKGILKLLLERQVEICQEEKIGKCYPNNKMVIWKGTKVCDSWKGKCKRESVGEMKKAGR